MSQAMGVNISTMSDPFKKIGEVNKLDKWVAHEFGKSQKARCFKVCSLLFLTCTCISFCPGRVELASSRASNMLLIEEDTLEFD